MSFLYNIKEEQTFVKLLHRELRKLEETVRWKIHPVHDLPLASPVRHSEKGNNPNCQQLFLGPQVKQTKWEGKRCEGNYLKKVNYASHS